MISEKKFAKEHQSFWEGHTPFFGEYYASINVLGKKIGKPIDIPENSMEVYINNLIATTHFKNLLSNPDYAVEQSFNESIPVIDIFSKKKREAYSLTEDYKQIISIQAERITGLYTGTLIHDPHFPGCGLLSNCNGDLICGTTLVEIKANREMKGRKPFRPEDFRQLLTYCAMNYLANDIYDIQKIHLFNPRMGYLWQSDLEEFVFLISNSTGADLFESIGNYLTELSESIDSTMGFNDSSF